MGWGCPPALFVLDSVLHELGTTMRTAQCQLILLLTIWEPFSALWAEFSYGPSAKPGSIHQLAPKAGALIHAAQLRCLALGWPLFLFLPHHQGTTHAWGPAGCGSVPPHLPGRCDGSQCTPCGVAACSCPELSKQQPPLSELWLICSFELSHLIP